MKIISFVAKRPTFFTSFILSFGLSLSVQAQQLQPETGAIRFLSPPCFQLCNPTFWHNSDDALILESIAALRDPNLLDESGKTALHYAIGYGNDAYIQALLAKGADPNAGVQDSDQASLLGYYLVRNVVQRRYESMVGQAGSAGDPYTTFVDTVRLLIDEGADLDSARDIEFPPFLSIIEIGNPELLAFLRDQDNYPDLLRKYEFQALRLAFTQQDKPMIEQFLSDGANLMSTDPKTGGTLLHALFPNGEAEYLNSITATVSEEAPKDLLRPLRLALEYGVDPNAPDSDGVTPLMMALGTHKMGTVTFLLERGADPERVDNNGNSALFYLFQYRQSFDVTKDEETDELAFAPQDISVSPELFTLLIDAGADPLHRNASGETLLHVVAKGPMTSNYNLLTPYFTDFDVHDARGRTPLLTAITYRQTSNTFWIGYVPPPIETRIEALLGHGADINATDDDGATALYRLITDDTPYVPMRLKRYLLEKGAVSIAPGGIECVIVDIPDYDFLSTRRGTEIIPERVEITQTCQPSSRD